MGLLNLFAPGASLTAKVILIGGVALVSAGAATGVTANYYNNKIIAAQTTEAEKLDAAVQKGATDAMAAQKAADGKMADARVADQAARDAREKGSTAASGAADDFLKANPASASVVCVMPGDTAKAINQVLK